MPLDPGLQMLLDLVNGAGVKPLSEMPLDEARSVFNAMSTMRGVAVEVGAVVNRTVPGPAGDIPVRIYQPLDADGPLPILVWLHGGGWVIGNLDTTDDTCRNLANRAGVVVVSVDYRLAPEHPWPAGPDDSWAALQWVVANAAELGGDAGEAPRVAVGGDSAGGNLAAVMANRAHAAGGPALAQQLLVYPATDATLSSPSIEENGEGYFLTRADMTWFTQCYVGAADPKEPDISPLHAADLSGVAPAQVITAEFDPLRDEGLAYAERLAEAGVAVESTCYPSMIHGFFSMNGLVATADTAVDAAAASLRKAFGLPPRD